VTISGLLIGREKECRLVGDLMRQRRNVLILGEEGVGKSAIVENVLSACALNNVLYSKHSATLKETLVNLVESAIGDQHLQKKTILSLKNICYRLLDRSPEYVVLDHVAWVEPKFYGFLIYLIERKLPFIMVTRRSGKKNIGHLWKGLYDFERLEINNLDQPRACKLMDYYAECFDLNLDMEADFRKEIFSISKGNPRVIKELCCLARDEKYKAKGYIDVKLMDLDRRINWAIR
jgi:AAA domain (dynein-related subfamily)